MHRCLDIHRAWAVLALGLAAAPAVHAQSANCEAFKARVAASIEGKGISGYALEWAPGRAAAPPGARAVGTCDGGAYTLLYRRWAGAGAAAAATAAATATAAANGSDAQPTAQTAADDAAKSVPKGAARAAARAKPAPLPKPAAEPAPVAVPTPPISPAPSPAPSVAATAAAPKAPAVVAAVVPPPRGDAPPAPAAPPAVPAAPPAAAAVTTRSFDDAARPVVWAITGLLAVYAGVRLWRRWRHRRYYDEAGLPRGPRITL